jgi:uroporphyrinogen-III synthase
MSEKTVGVFNKPSNQKLISEIKSNGANIFLLPHIETSLQNDLPNFDPNQFDWIIFTDCYAVDYFMQMLENNNLDKFELDNLRLCAIGEAVSDKLRMFQIHADVIPSKLDDETIFQSICNYELPKNIRYFITEKNTNLTKLLQNANAKVIETAIYQTKFSDAAKINVLIKNGAFDEIVFTSPNEVNDWKIITSSDNFISSFYEIIPFAYDTQTFQYLYEHGLKPRNYRK